MHKNEQYNAMDKIPRFGVGAEPSWAHVPASPLHGCLSVVRLLIFSKAKFYHLSNEENDIPNS